MSWIDVSSMSWFELAAVVAASAVAVYLAACALMTLLVGIGMIIMNKRQ